MKKIIYILTLFVLVISSLFFSINPQANSGPPANLEIEITGLTEEYILDIFIYQENELTQNQIDDAEVLINHEHFDQYFYQINYPDFLVSFQDQDNYVSNTLYGSVDYFYHNEQGHEYIMFLNVPRIFKIVLINQDNELIISKIITMKSYDFDITWDLTDVTFSDQIRYDAGVLHGLDQNPFYNLDFYIYMVLRIIISIAIEGFIFYLFGFRKKSTYIIFSILNIVTQVALTLGTIYSYYRGDTSYGTVFIFIGGEFLVFAGEMLILTLLIREKKLYQRTAVVFLANLLSMILGLIISLNIINLF